MLSAFIGAFVITVLVLVPVIIIRNATRYSRELKRVHALGYTKPEAQAHMQEWVRTKGFTRKA